MFPGILLSEIFVDFLPCYSESSFHVTSIIISILNLTPNVNNVVLISWVTVPVIIPTVFNCLPNLRLCSCLISCSYVLQSFETPHVSKILLYFRSLHVTIQKHVSNYFQHVSLQNRSYIFHSLIEKLRLLLPLLKFIVYKDKGHDSTR